MRQDVDVGRGQVRLSVVLSKRRRESGRPVLGPCLGRKLSQSAHAMSPPSGLAITEHEGIMATRPGDMADMAPRLKAATRNLGLVGRWRLPEDAWPSLPSWPETARAHTPPMAAPPCCAPTGCVPPFATSDAGAGAALPVLVLMPVLMVMKKKKKKRLMMMMMMKKETKTKDAEVEEVVEVRKNKKTGPRPVLRGFLAQGAVAPAPAAAAPTPASLLPRLLCCCPAAAPSNALASPRLTLVPSLVSLFFCRPLASLVSPPPQPQPAQSRDQPSPARPRASSVTTITTTITTTSATTTATTTTTTRSAQKRKERNSLAGCATTTGHDCHDCYCCHCPLSRCAEVCCFRRHRRQPET